MFSTKFTIISQPFLSHLACVSRRISGLQEPQKLDALAGYITPINKTVQEIGFVSLLVKCYLHWPDRKSSIDVIDFFAISHFNSDL